MGQLLHPLMRDPKELARVPNAEPQLLHELPNRDLSRNLHSGRILLEALTGRLSTSHCPPSVSRKGELVSR